eukprot:1090045-Rhodomonas_salina.1
MHRKKEGKKYGRDEVVEGREGGVHTVHASTESYRGVLDLAVDVGAGEDVGGEEAGEADDGEGAFEHGGVEEDADERDETPPEHQHRLPVLELGLAEREGSVVERGEGGVCTV